MPLFHRGETLIRESSAKETERFDTDGKLSLTNMRLIFEKEEGLFSKKRRTLIEFGFDSIHNVATEGLMFKALSVEVAYSDALQSGFTIEKYSFRVGDTSEWENDLLALIQETR